ncbi:MAG: IS3 family transposase [Rhodospirillaceae bacterium]|nr:IS3 family transposase [Rhodospirillaceae bacterium]
MIAFIDDHRGAHGGEPICKVLPIAPSTYHDHAARRADLAKLSARAQRDLVLKPEIERVFAENFEVYGARKVWRQMNRKSIPIARCTVERLMADLGLRGVIRGKPVRTTLRHTHLDAQSSETRMRPFSTLAG